MTTSQLIHAVAPGSHVERWLRALKPASWPKLFLPMLLGQCLGVANAGSFSAAAALFGVVFTLLDLAFIVLVNDWGDREVDALKRRMFPESSFKTIPDAILPERHVLVVGLAAGAAAVALGFVGGVALSRPLLGWASLACVALFVAYTLPPIAANYRGGGELFEMLGVGLALPWLNAYAQSPTLAPQHFALLAGFCALCLSSAIASGLGDEQSDRAGRKTTLVTLVGNRRARRVAELCLPVGAMLWILASVLWPEAVPVWAAAAAAAVVLWQYARTRAASSAAMTNAFASQGRYKREIHRAIWWGAAVLAVCLLVAQSLIG